MATHSSILAWRIPVDRRAWKATVQGRKESDLTERLSTAQHIGTKLALAELNFLLKGSTVE